VLCDGDHRNYNTWGGQEQGLLIWTGVIFHDIPSPAGTLQFDDEKEHVFAGVFTAMT